MAARRPRGAAVELLWLHLCCWVLLHTANANPQLCTLLPGVNSCTGCTETWSWDLEVEESYCGEGKEVKGKEKTAASAQPGNRASAGAR